MTNNSNTQEPQQEPQSLFYVATLLVDVEVLRKTRAQDIGDVAAAEEDLDESVMQEMGWTASLGLGTYILEKIEPIDGTPVLFYITVMYDGLEFEERQVVVVPQEVQTTTHDLVQWADENIAKCYMEDEEPTETDEGYEYSCGRLVSISTAQVLTEADYHALKKYL